MYRYVWCTLNKYIKWVCREWVLNCVEHTLTNPPTNSPVSVFWANLTFANRPSDLVLPYFSHQSPPSFSFSLKLSFPCIESQHLHQKSKIFQQSRTDKALLNRQLFPWTESQHLHQASRFSERNREQWRNLLNFYGEFEGSCLGLYFGGIRYWGLVGHAHESGCWLETESISNFRFRLPGRPRRRWNGGSVDAVSCSVNAVSFTHVVK
jgi:hypothetical protein